MAAFLKELLLQPLTEKGVFCADYVESEKKNLIATIESQLNDKRAYAMERLIENMCREDSFGIPRLGDKRSVAAITPDGLYAHYKKILSESRVDMFYVGSAPAQEVAGLVKDIFAGLERNYVNLTPQTPLHPAAEYRGEEQMDVNQGKLCMGFVTPVTIRDEGFVANQLMNAVFGGGMTSKLFSHIRETLSLCYAIGSGYHGSKGLLTVSAGIDSGMAKTVEAEVLAQLEACRRGEISEEELTAAKQSLRSSLLATHDSPGSIESYYANGALSGLQLDPQAYMERVEATTLEQVQKAAQKLQLHSVFFLKGVQA